MKVFNHFPRIVEELGATEMGLTGNEFFMELTNSACAQVQ